MSAGPRDCPPRFATARTESRKTMGGMITALARILGWFLMPWQQLVADVALEVDPEGRPYYREVRLTVPRQQGKTVLLLLIMVLRCLKFGPDQRVVFTMQDGLSARKKLFEDFVPILERSRLRHLIEIRRSNGSESVRWPNGSLWSLLTAKASSGHGFTVDLPILDEAALQADARIEQAVLPGMATRTHAQWWLTGTQGTTDDGEWFNEKVDAGRELVQQGVNSGVAFFEWSAPADCDPADEEVWWACIPALGHTIEIEVVRAAFMSMPADEFKRSWLNIRQDRRATAPWKVIPQHAYEMCGTGTVEAGRAADPVLAAGTPLIFGLEVAQERVSSVIGVCGLNQDDVPQIELVDNRNGTDWVLDRLAGLSTEEGFVGVAIDTKSEAATFIDKLEARDINVIRISTDDRARYAAGLLDAFKVFGVRHRDQEALTAAASGAVKRNYGDRWLFNRRDALVDVAPLEAVVIAHGALVYESVELPTFAY